MSSNSLQVALLCSDAAEEFIKNNEEFEVVGPVVKNSDVLILNESNPKKIAVSQKRIKDSEIIKKKFKDQVEIVPTLHNILPYVLEKGEVDGVIIDAKNATFLNGYDEGAYEIIGEYISYVMVVNKKFRGSKEFGNFIEIYNDGVDEINNDYNKLFHAIKLIYNTGEFSEKEANLWKKWKVEFLKIQ